MIFDLKNKTTLITGGGGLLGPEHAIILSKYNSKIILIDIDKKKLVDSKNKILKSNPNAKVTNYIIDITNEKEIFSLDRKLNKKGQKIDILINNAAIDPKMNNLNSISGTVENYNLDFLKKEIDVGLIGAFNCSKIFGSRMAKKKKGCIINIASDLAIVAPDQRVYSSSEQIEDVKSFKPIGYSLIKSGMLGLNRYLATYWAHLGVRVNCLVPGAVKNKQSKHLIRNISKRIPLRRLAKKNEYQGAIIFLASDASSYMTGQILVVDGGRTIW